jgi:hypothetical protein
MHRQEGTVWDAFVGTRAEFWKAEEGGYVEKDMHPFVSFTLSIDF